MGASLLRRPRPGRPGAAARRPPGRRRDRSGAQPRRSTSCWRARSARRDSRNWRWARWSRASRRSSRATKTSFSAAGIDERAFAAATQRARAEIEDARRRFLGERPRAAIPGRAAILVDDGVATGATALAALQGDPPPRPKTLTLAVPVASLEALAALRGEVDDVVCLVSARPASAPSALLRRFPPSRGRRGRQPFSRAFRRPSG